MGIFNKKIENSYKYEQPIPSKKSIRYVETTKYKITPKISEYINALESASSKMYQNRNLLYDYYATTLMVDDVVQSLIEKRMDNITNKNLVILKNGEKLEELNYFLTSPKFQSFVKDLIMNKFWGFSVYEFDEFQYDNKKWFEYKKIPNKNVNPFRKEILVNQWDTEGISFEKLNNYLFVGDENDLGLLSKISLLSLYNRLSITSYSEYLELASQNFTQIKTRGYEVDSDMDDLTEQLLNRGKGGVIRMPEGVDAEYINQSSSQQNQLFEGYLDRIKERLTILILGQTMTTSDGGSYSQSIIHQSEQQQKYNADELYVLNILNYEFKDYLKIWFKDLNVNELEFKFVDNNSKLLKYKIEIYKELKDLGAEFNSDEIKKIFGELL